MGTATTERKATMSHELMQRYIEDLKLKGYKKRSIQSYVRAVQQLQNFYSLAPEEISEEQVRGYWLYCKEDLGWSTATLRIAYSGIQHFYTFTVKRDWEVLRAVKFERQVTYPVVLSLDEVRLLLQSAPNQANRAFFTLAYGCGLRVSEAIHLRVGDIDGQRKCVHVHQGKGGKDRYVPVADDVLGVVRDYYRTHRNPTWVFPAHGRSGTGAHTADHPVSITTVQGAMRRTLHRCGITKAVHMHTLRHSYATHLIEAGVPVRHVQECLGHESLASTMIYLHITSHGREESRARLNQLMRGVLA